MRPPELAAEPALLLAQGIKQFFVAVEREEWKFDTLCDLYDTLTITQAVIFTNTKRKVLRTNAVPALLRSLLQQTFWARSGPSILERAQHSSPAELPKLGPPEARMRAGRRQTG